MKQLLLLSLICFGMFVACNEIKQQPDKYQSGDMVQTKFGDTVLIISVSCRCAILEYNIKRKGDKTEEQMKEPELGEKIMNYEQQN